MTRSKREPFSSIPHRFNGWITVGPCSFLTMMSGDDLRGDVDSINAAFNARVDEEMRKTVEKFRERAAKSCADHFGSREGKEYGDALASMIRTLPTEPEGK